MSAPTLPELIKQLTMRPTISPHAVPGVVASALTEIDRRLTALEARTAQLEDDRGPASDPRGE